MNKFNFFFFFLPLYIFHFIFLKVCKVAPNDRDAKKKLDECTKIVHRIAFEEAINSEKAKVIVSDTIDLANFS